MTDPQKDSKSLCHWLPWAHKAMQHCSMGGQAGGTRPLKGRGYRAERWVCNPQSSVRSKFTLPSQVAPPPSPHELILNCLGLVLPNSPGAGREQAAQGWGTCSPASWPQSSVLRSQDKQTPSQIFRPLLPGVQPGCWLGALFHCFFADNFICAPRDLR